MFGRRRSPDAIRHSALDLAARKLDEGCAPCAERYFALAKQNGAGSQDVQQARLGRRAVLARAGMVAGTLSVISLADPATLLAAPNRSNGQPKLEPISTAQARALETRMHTDHGVALLESRAAFGPAAVLSAYHAKNAGQVVIRAEGNRSLVVILADGAVHAALYVADAAYTVVDGKVGLNAALTTRYRKLLNSSHERTLADTVAHVLSPNEAEAACPACAQLLGACALGAEACRRGCAPCCAVAAGACIAALVCCAQPG